MHAPPARAILTLRRAYSFGASPWLLSLLATSLVTCIVTWIVSVYAKPGDQVGPGLITGCTASASLVALVTGRRCSEAPAALPGASGPPGSNQVPCRSRTR
jgi:hypothetical protein